MYRKSINLRAAIPLIVFCFGLAAAAKAQENVTLLGASPAANFSQELLKRADVQNELRINAKQKEALAKALSESNTRTIVRTYPDISKLSERRQWQAEINRQAAQDVAFIMNERRREVEEILRPDQRKRLTEIDLQWRGILALVDRGLSDRLGILPDHYKVIQQIVAGFEVKRIGLSSAYDAVDLYQKRQVLLREYEQKILTLLSDEEKARWSQAIGRPFKFDDLKLSPGSTSRGISNETIHHWFCLTFRGLWGRQHVRSSHRLSELSENGRAGMKSENNTRPSRHNLS